MTAAAPTAVVDVGGTGIKGAVLDAAGLQACSPLVRRTPYPCPPERLLDEVARLLSELPVAGRVSVGFPGLLRSDRVVWVNSLMRRAGGGEQDPELVSAWLGYPLQDALVGLLGLPTRVANDADVAALASVAGAGFECVLTLGTGVGSSLVQDGVLMPHLELGGMPLRDGLDLEAALGAPGLAAAGRDRWTQDVLGAVAALRRVLYFDRLFVGGGNARLLAGSALPDDVTLVGNVNGLLGGHYLWEPRTS